MASTANPDDEGIINPRKKKIINNTRINSGPFACFTSDDEKFNTVSEISPSFIILLIPRARPMINDTPTKLDAPLTNASTTFFSPNPFLPNATISIITMVKAKNIDAIIGNHHP